MKIKLVGKPKDAPYLTPGKAYESKERWINAAIIADDEGEEITIHLPNHPHPCPHARPAKWEIVE